MEITFDTSALYLEPHDVLDKFFRVIHEKEAVVRAFRFYDDPAEGHANASGSCVLAEGVNEIADNVKRLCGYFVDEQESHARAIPGSYENFPRTLAERFRNDPDHSLGPDIIAQYESFPPESLDKYRRLLSNCAYWLNQMYMIEVPLQYNDSSWGDYMQGVTQEWSLLDKNGRYQSQLYWSDYYDGIEEGEEDYYTREPVEVSGFRERDGRTKMTLSYGVEWIRWNDMSAVRVNPGEWPPEYTYEEVTWGADYSKCGRRSCGVTGSIFTHGNTHSGLWVRNDAPFDGVCKCFVIKNDTDHGKSGGNPDWYGSRGRGGRYGYNSIGDQNKKWVFIEGGANLCSNLYVPPGYEDYKNPWSKNYPGRVDWGESNRDIHIITENGDKKFSERRSIVDYNTGGDWYGRANHARDIEYRWNYSVPNASESVCYLNDVEERPASAVSGSYYWAPATNELTIYANEWYGFGLTSDPSIPVEAPLAAHTKDFVIAKWDSAPPIPTPDWSKYDRLFNWTQGSQYYRETREFHWNAVVVPIMDYRDSLSTITMVEPEE